MISCISLDRPTNDCGLTGRFDFARLPSSIDRFPAGMSLNSGFWWNEGSSVGSSRNFSSSGMKGLPSLQASDSSRGFTLARWGFPSTRSLAISNASWIGSLSRRCLYKAPANAMPARSSTGMSRLMAMTCRTPASWIILPVSSE